MKKLINRFAILSLCVLITISAGIAGKAFASAGAPALYDLSTTVGNSSATILSANNGLRKYLLIQNVGSSNLGINFDSNTAAIGTQGTVTLPQYGSLEFTGDHVPQNALKGICAGATCYVTIWELR